MNTRGKASPRIEMATALEAIPLHRLALWVALAAIAFSVAVLCPRFDQWTPGYPYSWESFRGAQFVMQCADPLRRDIAPALHWRLLPACVGHTIGLRGPAALIIPWIGVAVLLASTFHGLVRHRVSRVHGILAVMALALTAGVLAPVDWLGINDAWTWSALTLVVFGRGRWSLIVPGLLGPWIDERYLVGLPLAVCVRTWLTFSPAPVPLRATVQDMVRAVVWTLPYLIIRGATTVFAVPDGTGDLLQWTIENVAGWLPNVPLGWWLGARAMWVLPLFWMFGMHHEDRFRFLPFAAATLLSTLCFSALLACDVSRTTGIVWPVFLGGLVALERIPWPKPIYLLGSLLALNAFLPGGHAVDRAIVWLPSWFRFFFQS